MKHSNRTLLKGGHVLTLDPALGNLRQADLLIEDTTIAAIAPSLSLNDAQVIDASHMIVMPGLIDTHRHLWETSIRGIAADYTLSQYLKHILGTFAPVYRPEDVYIGNLLGVLEAINAGITTIFDWSHIMNTPQHAEAAIRGLRDSGARAIFGYGTPGTSVWEWFYESKLMHPEDIKRIQSQYFASIDNLVTLAMAIRGPEHSTLEVTRHDIILARELGLPISMHIGGGSFGLKYQGVRKLQEAGLLGPDLNFAHGNTLSVEDLQLLALHGCSLSITPEIEMQMGLGFPVTGSALAYEINTGLGIDVVTGTGGDMFSQMRMALQTERALYNQDYIAKGEMPETLPISVKDILQMATIGGATALGLAYKTGSLTPGKQADIIMIDSHSLNLFPVNDPVSAVVLQAHPANVDTVFIAGKAVKQHGHLRYHNLERVREQALASRDYLIEKSKVNSLAMQT